MKVFTVGAAGAGNTTVCRLLRVIEGLSVLDMDDEIMRLPDRNQGVIRELWDAGLFDHVISGEQAPECVAEELLAYARETPSRVTS